MILAHIEYLKKEMKAEKKGSQSHQRARSTSSAATMSSSSSSKRSEAQNAETTEAKVVPLDLPEKSTRSKPEKKRRTASQGARSTLAMSKTVTVIMEDDSIAQPLEDNPDLAAYDIFEEKLAVRARKYDDLATVTSATIKATAANELAAVAALALSSGRSSVTLGSPNMKSPRSKQQQGNCYLRL